MDERIREITSELAKAADDTTAAFGGFTLEQLNWKPSETGWSIGQCLDHIIKTNERFFPEFEILASGKRKNSFWESWSPLTGWGGRFLINAVTVDSKKSKVPSKKIVPPSNIQSDIIKRFSDHVEAVNQRIEACAGADRKRTVVTSPFVAVLTFSLDDAYTVLVEHSKRHIRQAKRVAAEEGFPQAARAEARTV